MRKLHLVLVQIFASALLLMSGVATYAGADKTDVCHITGTYDFGSGIVPTGNVINIADPAYPAHLDHGDPETWAIVYDSNGKEMCTASADAVTTVFVTSEVYNGDLVTTANALGGDTYTDGLLAGDALCTASANKEGSTVPHVNYTAWLSDNWYSSTNAIDRIPDGPYVRPDGLIVAIDKADLTDGDLAFSIDLDENGIQVADYVWTGTFSTGHSGYKDCIGWTERSYGGAADGISGNAQSTSSHWTNNDAYYCESEFHLYCFQSGQ